jgi:ABC-2 type transport system ATP-binding protein
MDEAERCHRINYIAYGRLVASGTVEGVIAGAGLTTFVLEGTQTARAQALLSAAPGVEQVAPFGATLHVVGTDAALLEESVARVAAETGTMMRPSETSLEDVFIKFMGDAQDNMA